MKKNLIFALYFVPFIAAATQVGVIKTMNDGTRACTSEGTNYVCGRPGTNCPSQNGDGGQCLSPKKSHGPGTRVNVLGEINLLGIPKKTPARPIIDFTKK